MLGRYSLRSLKIGSRKSALAKLQSYLVANSLLKLDPSLKIEFYFKESLGDKDLTSPLWKMGDKGVFTRDFKEDLLQEKVDLVVHSYKDLELDQSPETTVFSVLNRADQRDLLLFKKTALLEPPSSEIRLMSSSPRREYNLKPFLKKALPLRLQGKEILFEPVRGNVQTRLRKWIEATHIQGIVLAKAAMDRLLDESFPQSADAEYVEIRKYLREVLSTSTFMVLPLSVNPNAPAQGALAVEIKSSRKDVISILSQLKSDSVDRSVQVERKELRKYGGGCHQKIGVSVLSRPFGNVISTKGLTDSGVILDDFYLDAPRNIAPAKNKELLFPLEGEGFDFERVSVLCDMPQKDLFVSRISAWNPNWNQKDINQIVWAAGIRTLFGLANKDIWVHGTSDGLGESEPILLDTIANRTISFTKLTHKDSEKVASNIDKTYTYQLNLKLEIPNLNSKEYFFWMSGHQFDLALEKYPSIINKKHSCGPGITYNHIKSRLKPETPIDIFLSQKEWIQYHLKDM